MGHSCGRHSCGTLFWDTLVGHSHATVLWDTLAGHSHATVLWDTLLGHSCGTLLSLTSERNFATRLQQTYHMIPPISPLTSDTPRLRQHVSRSPVAWRHVNALSTKAAQVRKALRHHERNFATRSARTLEAFPTRLPPKEAYSLQNERFVSPASSLQDEHFVRDLLQKSHVKSPKRAVSTRLPQKLTCQSLQNERFIRDFLQKSSGSTHRSTHITQPCQAVSRFQPLQTTPAHTPIPMSQRHSPVPQLTTSRFPAPATNLAASTRLTRASKPAQSTAPATKSDNIISCELQQNLHHTTRLE